MGHWGKAGQALAGSIRGYGLPDMHLVMPCKFSLSGIIARHGKPLRTAYASSVHMRHPLGVHCHMQK